MQRVFLASQPNCLLVCRETGAMPEAIASLPAAVDGSRERGVVAAARQGARKFGGHSPLTSVTAAMSDKRALRMSEAAFERADAKVGTSISCGVTRL